MRAQDIMTTDVLTVTPQTTVHDTAKLMIDRRISGVPVVDSAGHLVGIVTDGDLYRRTELGTERKRRNWLEILGFDAGLAQSYVEGHAHTVADVMTTRVFVVTPQTTVQQIADLFERERIRRVPVIANCIVVGIVSRANLVQALAFAPVEDVWMNLAARRARDLVIAEYRRLPWGMPAESNVIVADGVVHLWGYVPSEAELAAFRVAVEAIPGVRGFEDHTFRFFGDAGRPQRKPSQVIVEEPSDPEVHETSTSEPLR